jgi:hypothetical protein
MPRNGSGVYTLPATSSFNPAVTGQQATAPDWNTTATDLAAAISQSVSADGQTTITGNMPFAGFRATGLGNPVNAQDAVTQAFLASFGGSYLRGLTLSNDVSTPNTVLDIAAGSCADSTNATPIIGTAFTKSTAGSWTAGTGNNGMGSGLTIAASTTYHVFSIINNGVYDVYFDTSVTAANKPASTTAFRRIGSRQTDGSAHWVAFVQDGDDVQLLTPVQDINVTVSNSSANTITLGSIPTGVRVTANLQPVINNSSASAATTAYFSDLATNDIATNAATFTDTPVYASAGQNVSSGGSRVSVKTNTSAQIRYRFSNAPATTTLIINTLGWTDRRGRDA